MPTETEYFGYSAHNLGPLTTTFTAPRSCATGTDHLVYANKTSLFHAMGRPTCGSNTFGDCIPSGESWDSVDRQTTKFVQGQSFYYSPGIACPSGWTTVGSLVHDGSGIINASGAMTMPEDVEGVMGQRLLPTDFWANVLEPSETLAYCCPSGYQADSYGECASSLGPRTSYNYTGMCITAVGWSFSTISVLDGTALSEPLISMASATVSARSSVDDRFFTGTGPHVTDYIIATHAPAVVLVHKGSDLDDESEDGGDGEAETTGENAAYTTSPRPGVVSVLGLALSILVGMGILM